MLHQFFYARKRNENFRDMGDSLPDQYRHAGIAGDSRREFGEWPSLRANLVIAAVEILESGIAPVPTGVYLYCSGRYGDCRICGASCGRCCD